MTELVTDPHLPRTAVDGERTVYWNVASGARFALGRAAAGVLEERTAPRGRPRPIRPS